MAFRGKDSLRKGWRRAFALVKRLRLNEVGAAALEFAMIAPLLIALTLGALQIGVIYFADAELARVTQKSARSVMLGGATGMTQAQFQASVCANLVAIFSCPNLLVSLVPQASCASISTTPPTLTFDVNGNVTNTFPFNSGTNGTVMVLQVMYLLPVIGGPFLSFANANGDTLLVSTVVFVNEP